MEEPKKISFGFAKKSAINPKIKLAPVKAPTVEYISSLEGAQFETIGGNIQEKKEDLVIPLKDSVPLWQRKLIAKKREKNLNKDTAENGIKIEPVSLDDLAAQELIREAAEKMAEKEVENINTSIYMNLEENEVEDDKDEPTQDNYAAIPVKDFGLAMLRGMGWAPGKGIGKNPQVVVMKEPEFRPRGMGLGVERKKPPKRNNDETSDLRMCKGAYVRAFQGPLQGCYGKVESLHDSIGRVLVKMALGGKSQSICEYMLELVTVKEYNDKAKLVTSENAALVQKSLDTKDGANGTEKAYGLVHLKKNVERSEQRKKSPERSERKKSPERSERKKSPENKKKERKHRSRTPERRQRSPDERRRSPERRKRSPERRKRSRSPTRRR